MVVKVRKLEKNLRDVIADSIEEFVVCSKTDQRRPELLL